MRRPGLDDRVAPAPARSTTAPHAATGGAGVAKAADDAIALAAALDRHAEVEAALKAFEAERIGIGRRIIERARHLGASMRTRSPPRRSGPSPSATTVHRR